MRVWVSLLALTVATVPTLAAPSCALTAADKAANAKLSYNDFDQAGTLSSTARAFDRAGCDLAAAEADEDYLMSHAGLSANQRNNVLFHEGQSLAKAGDERGAARLIAATKALSPKPDDPFDWNTYVEGTWAFLVKDHVRLEAAYNKLSGSGSEDNATNARVLHALITCFKRPYKEAYGSAGCSAK